MADLKAQKAVDLLMIGDSITTAGKTAAKGAWSEFYAKRNAFNIGYSGDRTEHVIWRLQHGEIDGIAPKLAVIMIGTKKHRSPPGSSRTNRSGHQEDPRGSQEKTPQDQGPAAGCFPAWSHQR
ncbi:MAG: hypothetical protein Ct9H300mP1_06620 [Planctomycetaceae bacterium]|nr:MAG: hypothetical protein Ct9H300mP1_06620 [Planctomycetaceae bacterium]